LKGLYWAVIIIGGLAVVLFMRGAGISIEELITGKRQQAPAMHYNPHIGGIERLRQVDFIPPQLTPDPKHPGITITKPDILKAPS
jgi:hypothetical protein